MQSNPVCSRLIELHRQIREVDDEDLPELLTGLANPQHPYIVSFVNAHAANLVWKMPALYDTLSRSDLLLRDGIGVRLGLFAFGRDGGRNMNGTDFIPLILQGYCGRRVALFGTRTPWLDRARATLEADGAVVVAEQDGFSGVDTYLEAADRAKPDLVILAMGMPRQEAVAVALRTHLEHPVLIVNGGAILDFLGGKVARAPRLMRESGLEWAYRLYLEPRRLAGRYLVGIPVFLSRVVRARLMVNRTG